MSSFKSSSFVPAMMLTMLAAMASPGRAAEKLKLLIIDGQNNHNWQAMTPPMKAELEKTGRFAVEVATTPPANAPQDDWNQFRPDFSRYNVVLSNYNGQLWPAEVRVALAKFVGNGGGLVIIHAANNAFPEWGEWNRMIGLGWRGNDFGDRVTLDDAGKPVRTEKGQGPGAGHGPQHEFVIDVHEPEHPVMQGMPLHWLHANDELYHGQRGPAADMHILASAFSSKDKGGTGAHEPMIWWIPYGKGRVFTTVMGHVGGNDTRAIRCVGFITVMNRGCEWAATGKVTLPIPENFPKADATSLVPDTK
ncbi:MAG: ThuA domain-containing protein [Deltaproteobacteria bacterium]